MRLKSLKLAGFKSFANPTTFSFRQNITAIVGPNGCGKSNVIDAIRWVLGETSAKQLRGGAMSDVIFAGTQSTSAKSLASVELTFEHTQDEQTGIRHELNLYHELSVRRQVNKEGKSDYFINGTRCRRRDVVDIFLGTGLGARSYAVIEQGMIGRIVDSSPMQLREFIEEGAGVSRYQVRRLETQKKLTQAEENLSRLHDLRSELEKQQRTLSRQADSAKKYKELTQQLHKLEQDIAIHQLYSAKHTEQLQQKEHKTLNKVVTDMQAELGIYTAKLDKLANRIAEQQWLKDDARDALHDKQLKRQQTEHTLAQHNTRIEQLTEKINSYRQQEKENQSQIETLKNKHKTETAQLATLTPQLAELQTLKANIQRTLEPLNNQWRDIHAKREDLQNEQRSLEKQHALAEQANHRIIQEESKWSTRYEHWQNAWKKLTEQSEGADISTLDTQLKTHKTQLASVQRQSEEVTIHVEEQQYELNKLKVSINETTATLQALEKHHATLDSEYNTLHSLVFPKKKDSINEQQLQNAKNNTEKLKLNFLKLSDSIELTALGKYHADNLDQWLAMWLDVLICPPSSQSISKNQTFDGLGDEWLQLLTQNKPDVKNTVVLNSVHINAPTPQPFLEDAEKKKILEKLIPLNTLIKAPKLLIWQNTYLYHIDDSTHYSHIQDMTQLLPNGALILTNTGWILGQFGRIHLSKLSKNNSDNHFLRQREQQRTRLTELEDQLNNIEDELDAMRHVLKKDQARHDEQQITLEELTAQANNLQNQTHESRQAITQLTAKFERQHDDQQRLNNDKQQLEQEKITIDNEKEQIANQLQLLNKTLPTLNQQLTKVEEERSQLRYERNNADNQSREIEGALQSLNLQQQQLKISSEHLEKQQESLQKQLQRLNIEQDKIVKDIEKLESELPSLETAVTLQQNLCHEQQIKLDEYQGQLSELQIQHSNEREAHNQKQIKVTNQQQKLTELTTNLAIAKERLNEACSRVDALANVQQTTPQQNKHKKTDSQPVTNTAMVQLTFIPARYPIISQDYHNPYQHKWQMFIATGQDVLLFANAEQLINALKIDINASSTSNGNSSTIANHAPSDLPSTKQTNTSLAADISDKPSLNVSSASLLAEFIVRSHFDPEKENIKQQKRQHEYQSLQMKVGRMGAVNLVAVEELEQINERLEPLTQQIDDIVESINKLTDAIKTIDEKTKELFMQTLESVNKDLLSLFNKVFGGGQASLTLIEDDNLSKADRWRAGLELMAQPKGKKNSRLAVLSGGEKTLTALSLIFAIFKQHPAPFCVLDEVDAPLDDANVGRFTGLINELANDLQFIFISHNKLSMQIADELKGITMPTAGISSLVSVNLDEAEKYIESDNIH